MNNTAENLMEPCEEAPVYVIGHMNPDTDSICHPFPCLFQ